MNGVLMNNEVLTHVRAQRGPDLRCKGWKQETILRMLENNMENAERAEDLVVYGGAGKAARNWESYHAIVRCLKQLGNEETLAIQAGMPVAVFGTHALAPRVVMANTNVINATWPIFSELQDRNLTTFSSYTAGPWQYIGSQGVIQGTFETLAAVGDRHFGSDLAGRILLTAGLGGMGKTQPRAMTLLGGICLVIEVRAEHIARAVRDNFCDVHADSLDHALELLDEARKERRALSVALTGNAAEIFPELVDRGWAPDIVTEMCPCHDPYSLVPIGVAAADAPKLLAADRDQYLQQSRTTMLALLRAMNTFHDGSPIVFEYGTFIRKECIDAGMPPSEATRFRGCIADYVRDLFELGRGPFRWTCVSGEVSDQHRLDQLALRLFPDDATVQRWIPLARSLPVEGLPARICFLGFGQRREFALAANELVASGEIAGPVAFSRDNLDSGSIANPSFETEGMRDGSDRISDWPYLNALLNTAAMADLVAIQANGTMGVSAHTGVTMIADGSDEARFRLAACLTTDAGIGVVRHAQAGYPVARKVADGQGPLSDDRIEVPLWWTSVATFGPNVEKS
jgi:urocanate hydratase